MISRATRRDVTIIGAGPAGSTCAIVLARTGCDVTLVEQSHFPRDKVCGECLSALGYEVLTRLGLTDVFHQLGAVQLNHTRIYARGARAVSAKLPAPMWGLSRRAFDALLLDVARGAGAKIRQGIRCEGVGSDHRVRLRNLETNAVEYVAPAHVILADGKASFASDAPDPTGDFGVKAHFENVDGPRDTIELFAVRGSYGGLAAIEGGRWNAAFSVPAARIKSCYGDLDSLWTQLKSENETLARRVQHARRAGPWLAAPLPRFSVRTKWQPNVIPVGNAAAALEPIGGEGMGLAMRSAELAAHAIVNSTTDELPERFSHLWQRRRIGCRAAALAVSQPVISRALVRPRIPRAAISAVLAVIGK